MKIVIIRCILLAIISLTQVTLFSQFTDLDFASFGVTSGATNGLYQDVFYANSTGPWILHGGSPDLIYGPDNPEPITSTFCQIGGSKGRVCYQYDYGGACSSTVFEPNKPWSESLIYKFNFLAGVKYEFSINMKQIGSADNVLIGLTNGLLENPIGEWQCEVDAYGNMYTPYRNAEPLYANDIDYIIYESEEEAFEWTQFSFCIIPDDDYSQLIFTVTDLDGEITTINGNCGATTTTGSTGALLFTGLDIGCCDDEIIYTTTEVQAEPNSPTTYHAPLPYISHAKSYVTAVASEGDILVQSVGPDNVVFKAGSSISIGATADNYFIVAAGTIFQAYIEDCDCGVPAPNEDYCTSNFRDHGVPVGTNVDNNGFEYIGVPTAFDPQGPDPEKIELPVIWGVADYVKPYNAYKAVWTIWDPASGSLFHKQEIDVGLCGEIPAGFFVWDGCVGNQSAEINIAYPWVLQLENCFNSTFDAPITGVAGLLSHADCSRKPNIVPDNSFLEDFSQIVTDKEVVLSNPNSRDNKLQVGLSISPNPSKEEVTIEYSTSTTNSTSVSLLIRNINGFTLVENQTLILNGIFKDVINLKDFPAGTYFVTIIDQGIVETQKLIIER